MSIPKLHCAGYWVFRWNNDELQTLLVESTKNFHSPPKGKREKNEDMIQCAQRELLEETGLVADTHLEIVPETFVVINSARGNPSVLCFVAGIRDEHREAEFSFEDDEEVTAVLWEKVEHALERNMLDDRKKVSLRAAADIFRKHSSR